MFPSSATGLLMSPRSHEIRTHNCVDVPNVCRRPRIDIDRICSDEIYNLLRAFYVYVCVCVCIRVLHGRNETDRWEWVRETLRARCYRFDSLEFEGWGIDLIDLQEDGFFGKEAWYFIYIDNVWKLFVDIKQKNYYFDWNIYLH